MHKSHKSIVGATCVARFGWHHLYTHILVNDPTTGCGIFIENMLDAAA